MVYDCWVRLSVIVRVSLSVMQSSWDLGRQRARGIPYRNLKNFDRLWKFPPNFSHLSPPPRGFSRKLCGRTPKTLPGDILSTYEPQEIHCLFERLRRGARQQSGASKCLRRGAAGSHETRVPELPQIGRASCRERG